MNFSPSTNWFCYQLGSRTAIKALHLRSHQISPFADDKRMSQKLGR